MKKNILIKTLLVIVAVFFNYEFLYKFGNFDVSLMGLNFNISLLVVYILSIVKKNNNIKTSKSEKIISILFTIFMITGEIISVTGNIIYLVKPKYILLTLIKVIGFYYLFDSILSFINGVIKNISFKKISNKKSIFNWYLKKLEKYPFRTSFISILIIFGIYIFAFYPIVLSPDPSFQIKMYFNVHTKYIDWVIQRNPLINMTNHHPIIHTYLLGGCISLGRKLINDNFGLFLYTLFQTLVYSSVLAYTVKFMKKNNVNIKYIFFVLLLYLFVPMYGFYTVSGVKDTYYTSFMILFVLFIYDFIHNYKEKKVSILYLVYLYFVILLLCLFRQNGLYVVILTMPFVMFYSKKNILRITSVFVSIILSMWCFNNLVIPALGVSDGSIREALSVPFQQTARLAKYHDDIIEEKDKVVIDKLLNYKTLGKRYVPTLSDKVKNQYNKNATKEDLKNYFKVWFKYLFKEPICYVNATLNNIHGYFYPVSKNWYFYYKYDTRILDGNLVNYHYVNSELLRQILTIYGTIYPYIPLIGLVSSIGMGLYFILYLISYLIDKKLKKYIIVLVPLITSILVCFVGPANTYFRYAMPYLYVLPALFGLLIKEMRSKNE